VVRDHDYDRYLCTLFAPARVREAWFTLFAFNHEIAVIAEMVSEEMIGLMRFAWWREALDKIYTGNPVHSHPVAEALAQVIHAHRLPRAPFDAMLAARTFDLQQEQFATFAELESYCRDTSAALLQLCSIAANMPVTPSLDDLGIAWALIGMARLQSRNDTVSTAELISAAERHLQAARLQRHKLLRAFAPFLDACEFYLKRLRSNKENRHPHSGRLRLILTLWLKGLI